MGYVSCSIQKADTRHELCNIKIFRTVGLTPGLDVYQYTAVLSYLTLKGTQCRCPVTVKFPGRFSRGVVDLCLGAIGALDAGRGTQGAVLGRYGNCDLVVSCWLGGKTLFEATITHGQDARGTVSVTAPEIVDDNGSPVIMSAIWRHGTKPGSVANTVRDGLLAAMSAFPRLKVAYFKPPNRVQCRVCKEVIESRARHEYVTCKCGAVSIDGGPDYTRICGTDNAIQVPPGTKMKYKYSPIYKGLR